jgi:hypothetical protein
VNTAASRTSFSGNDIDTQVGDFDAVGVVNAFIRGLAFVENLIGQKFDAEELMKRLRRGETRGLL